MEKTLTLKSFKSSPKWLLDYKERNLKVFLEKPLKKSFFINVKDLNELTENALKSKNNKSSINLNGLKAKVYSWEEAFNDNKLSNLIEIHLNLEFKPRDSAAARPSPALIVLSSLSEIKCLCDLLPSVIKTSLTLAPAFFFFKIVPPQPRVSSSKCGENTMADRFKWSPSSSFMLLLIRFS
mgnify:FL=1